MENIQSSALARNGERVEFLPPYLGLDESTLTPWKSKTFDLPNEKETLQWKELIPSYVVYYVTHLLLNAFLAGHHSRDFLLSGYLKWLLSWSVCFEMFHNFSNCVLHLLQLQRESFVSHLGIF